MASSITATTTHPYSGYGKSVFSTEELKLNLQRQSDAARSFSAYPTRFRPYPTMQQLTFNMENLQSRFNAAISAYKNEITELAEQVAAFPLPVRSEAPPVESEELRESAFDRARSAAARREQSALESSDARLDAYFKKVEDLVGGLIRSTAALQIRLDTSESAHQKEISVLKERLAASDRVNAVLTQQLAKVNQEIYSVKAIAQGANTKADAITVRFTNHRHNVSELPRPRYGGVDPALTSYSV